MQDKIDQYRQKQAEQAKEQRLLNTIENTVVGATATIAKTAVLISEKEAKRIVKVAVQNDIATSDDMRSVVDALNQLGEKIAPKDLEPVVSALTSVLEAISKLPKQLPKQPDIVIPEQRDNVSVNNLSELTSSFKAIVDAISDLPSKIELKPTIDVKPTDVVVEQKNIDISGVEKAISGLAKKLEPQKMPEFDVAPIVKSVAKLNDSINNLQFPVPNYVLPFKDTTGKAVQATVVNNAIVSDSPTYAVQIDDTTTANTTYIGKAPIGSATSSAVWQIVKLDTTSGLVKTWADGDSSFDNVFDDRASLTYS